tara:strand:- start:4051 stop:4254 length:204 start_codon:yes stop_codon:yes gene_type:complete
LGVTFYSYLPGFKNLAGSQKVGLSAVAPSLGRGASTNASIPNAGQNRQYLIFKPNSMLNKRGLPHKI